MRKLGWRMLRQNTPMENRRKFTVAGEKFRTNPTAITALCGPDDPCIPQGFRVLALEFDLQGIAIIGERFAILARSVALGFLFAQSKRCFYESARRSIH